MTIQKFLIINKARCQIGRVNIGYLNTIKMYIVYGPAFKQMEKDFDKAWEIFIQIADTGKMV